MVWWNNVQCCSNAQVLSHLYESKFTVGYNGLWIIVTRCPHLFRNYNHRLLLPCLKLSLVTIISLPNYSMFHQNPEFIWAFSRSHTVPQCAKECSGTFSFHCLSCLISSKSLPSLWAVSSLSSTLPTLVYSGSHWVLPCSRQPPPADPQSAVYCQWPPFLAIRLTNDQGANRACGECEPSEEKAVCTKAPVVVVPWVSLFTIS